MTSNEEERKKILEMIADGTISAEEALKLLDALNQKESSSEFRSQEMDSHPQGRVFCVPGGKCYTLDELKKLDRPPIPKFDLNGETNNAES